jgi:glycosyltransferase involved in cell wall biosynthesis
MINLSAIIIACNEKNNIGRCLQSLNDVIDDIVVLIDSKTTDGTEDVVKSFPNVNYETVEWRGYGPTKNYALTKTKYDWVLWIDADEELTPELKEELINFKKSKPQHDAYYVKRRAFFLGKWIKHCGWYPGYVLRLFNKNKARFDSKNVHEGLQVEGKKGYLKNDLNHYTDPDVKHYFEKFNNYTTLAAGELHSKGKRAGMRDLLLRPPFLFLKMYILRLGFLDGLHGLILSVFSSLYVFTKYVKLWEMDRK